MKFENIRVMNFENALRGMRNPKESYELSDSYYGIAFNDSEEILRLTNGNPYEVIYADNDVCEYASIGPNDMKLAQTLIKAGSEHRKFMRQIFVSVDITAPIYWWKEMDTYKVATTANSTSTMHTIQKKPINFDRFELSDYHPELSLVDDVPLGLRIDCFINDLEQLRQLYNYYIELSKTTEDKAESDEYLKTAKLYWKELIRWTPQAWLQTRTWTGSYENLFGMCSPGQRRHHK